MLETNGSFPKFGLMIVPPYVPVRAVEAAFSQRKAIARLDVRFPQKGSFVTGQPNVRFAPIADIRWLVDSPRSPAFAYCGRADRGGGEAGCVRP